jgi:hypothetical protein
MAPEWSFSRTFKLNYGVQFWNVDAYSLLLIHKYLKIPARQPRQKRKDQAEKGRKRKKKDQITPLCIA